MRVLRIKVVISSAARNLVGERLRERFLAALEMTTNSAFLIILSYFLIFTNFAFASYTDFQKELDYEKLLEEKLKKELAEILGAKKFIVIVDISKKVKEVRGEISLPGEEEGISDLGVPLPGMLESKETSMPQTPEVVDTGAPSEAEFNPANYIKAISLYLESEVTGEVLDILKRRVTQIVQLKSEEGDSLVAKVAPIAEVPVVAEGVAPPALQNEPEKGETKLGQDLWIIIGAAGALLVFVVLLMLLLLKGRGGKAREVSQMAALPTQTIPVQAPRVEAPQAREQQAASAPSKATEEATKAVSKDLLKQEIINQTFSRPDLLASIISDWVIEENGLRQAAALIKIFGLDTAMNLMADVGSGEKSKILAFYNTVDNWDIQEELVSLNRLKTGLVARKYEQHLSSEGSDSSHFSFIKKLSDYQLFYLIKDEDARVIALLMTYLPPDRSAKLIAQLSPKQKSQVAVEIGNINYINADILQAVTKRLAEKSLMIPKFELYPGSGINSLVSILDHLESKDETFVINTIKEFDPTLAQKIKKAYFVFEDLFGLTKEALKTIIKDVPKTALATSLVGGDENFIAKILSILPERKAEMLKFDIEKSKNAPQSEILKAKKELVIKIREMIRTGEIDLEKALKPVTESTAPPKQQNGGATHAQTPTQAPAGTAGQAVKAPPQGAAPKQPQSPPHPGVKVNPEVHAAPKQNVVK